MWKISFNINDKLLHIHLLPVKKEELLLIGLFGCWIIQSNGYCDPFIGVFEDMVYASQNNRESCSRSRLQYKLLVLRQYDLNDGRCLVLHVP